MSRSRKSSTGTPATVAIRSSGLPFTLHSYRHDPRARYFGLVGAQELGVDPERVFKTLVVQLEPGHNALATAVIPAEHHLDLKAIASLCNAKHATLAEPALAQRVTGFVRGGISPLGQKHHMPILIDRAACEFPTIFVSGGRRGLSIEMAPGDVVKATGAMLAAISKPGLHAS